MCGELRSLFSFLSSFSLIVLALHHDSDCTQSVNRLVRTHLFSVVLTGETPEEFMNLLRPLYWPTSGSLWFSMFYEVHSKLLAVFDNG